MAPCIKHQAAFLHTCILIFVCYSERVSHLISSQNQIRADAVGKRRKPCHLCRNMTRPNCALNTNAWSFISQFRAATKWAERAGGAYLAVQEAVKHRDEEALRGRGGSASAGDSLAGWFTTDKRKTHLEGLQERVEIDEDDLGDLVLARVDEEEHVGDAQQRQQDQRGLHCFPAESTGVTGGLGPTCTCA